MACLQPTPALVVALMVMKVRSQILLNNGVILALLVVVAAGMYDGVSTQAETAHWVAHTHEVMTKARELAKFMVDMETGQRGFMLTGQESFLEPFVAGEVGFADTMRVLRKLVSDNPSQLERLARVQRQHDEWLELAGQREIDLRRAVDRGAASFDSLSHVLQGRRPDGSPEVAGHRTGKQRMDEIRALIDQIVAAEMTLLAERREDNAGAVQRSRNVALFGAVFAALCAFLVGTWVRRRITEQLGAEPDQLRKVAEQVAAGVLSQQVVHEYGSGGDNVASYVNRMIQTFRRSVQQTDEIARGNLEVSIQPLSDDDELGTALHRMTSKLREATAVNERDAWLKAGQAELAQVMSGEQDLPTLCKTIVSQMAKYIDAAVGALYVADEDRLRLVGSYAFMHRKGMHAETRFGEGLVGQAALEQELITVSDLPDDYVVVTSGLGCAPPKCLALVPLMHDGTLLGVVELGCLRPLTTDQLALLKLLAPNAAVGINSSKERRKTQALLEETKQQAANLTAQQEALTVANDSLARQAHTLQQSEEQLRETNAQLREQGEALRVQAADMERQKAELAQASRYKSEFLSNMSHELRTPLNSMLLLSQSLAQNAGGNLTADQAECASVIHSSGEELLALINEILDLSKIEAGHMSVRMESVRVGDLVDGLGRQFSPLASQASLTLHINVHDGVPEVLWTDGQRLRQILKTLLSHAIKFTPSGRVEVHFQMLDGERPTNMAHANGVLAIRVVDSGIGIPEERRRAIFEAFQQADGSTSRIYGGTGLGLTISRKLADMLGGALVLDSTGSSGSTFCLYLPTQAERTAVIDAAADAKKVDAGGDCMSPAGSEQGLQGPALTEGDSSDEPQADAVAQPRGGSPGPVRVQGDRSLDVRALQGVRVLVVDDDGRNLFALSKVLTEVGMVVDCATNGQLAIEKLEASEGTDLVVMDIMMPVMDGLEAIRRIRAMQPHEHLPMVAITAQALPSSRQACLEAGAHRYLAKPVDPRELVDTMLDLLSWSGAREQQGGAA